jgi:DNA-binding NarL/FixJ family response regulator
MIKVLLVDDEPSVRQGLQMRLALEPNLHVVGEAGDGLAALKAVQALDPDVVVTDVDMPKMDGITMIKWLREVSPSAAAIVLTVYDHEEVQTRARDAGADAFIGKQDDVEHLIEAIHRVAIANHTDNQEACP